VSELAAPLAPHLAGSLDRTSPIPLYFQLAEQLERSILDGALPPGSRLENESSLAAQLGLSRPTVRQAVAHLVDKGLLVRKRGVGTQVVQSRVRRPLKLTSLYDDLARDSREPRTDVLTHEVVPATAPVAVALGVEPQAPVLHLERLRYAGNEPLALLRNWLPERFAAVAADALAERGLYALLRDLGVHMRVADQEIGARLADTTEASLLAEPPGAALLTMARTTCDDSGAVVEHGDHLYRASRYTFELTLVER